MEVMTEALRGELHRAVESAAAGDEVAFGHIVAAYHDRHGASVKNTGDRLPDDASVGFGRRCIECQIVECSASKTHPTLIERKSNSFSFF